MSYLIFSFLPQLITVKKILPQDVMIRGRPMKADPDRYKPSRWQVQCFSAQGPARHWCGRNSRFRSVYPNRTGRRRSLSPPRLSAPPLLPEHCFRQETSRSGPSRWQARHPRDRKQGRGNPTGNDAVPEGNSGTTSPGKTGRATKGTPCSISSEKRSQRLYRHEVLPTGTSTGQLSPPERSTATCKSSGWMHSP